MAAKLDRDEPQQSQRDHHADDRERDASRREKKLGDPPGPALHQGSLPSKNSAAVLRAGSPWASNRSPKPSSRIRRANSIAGARPSAQLCRSRASSAYFSVVASRARTRPRTDAGGVIRATPSELKSVTSPA